MSGVLNAFWGSAFASASGGYFQIATVTAAGGETSLTFSSIPATYTDLQIRGVYRDLTGGTANSDLNLQFNGSNSTYASHSLRGNSSLAIADGFASQTYALLRSWGLNDGALANAFGAGIIDIADYLSTSKNKTLRYFNGSEDNTAVTNHLVAIGSGVWVATPVAVTSIALLAGGTFKAGSTFTLYGIKAFA